MPLVSWPIPVRWVRREKGLPMANYVINEGYDNSEKVEGAVKFRHADGYFYFTSSQDVTVYAISADHVQSIKRVE